MKSQISLLVLMAATGAVAEPPEAIQRITLDERVVITVPVATNHVTTISFPGPIAAIDAVGVTTDGKTPGQFQLAHTKGSSFVSVRALVRAARETFTIPFASTKAVDWAQSVSEREAIAAAMASRADLVASAVVVEISSESILCSKAPCLGFRQRRIVGRSETRHTAGLEYPNSSRCLSLKATSGTGHGQMFF